MDQHFRNIFRYIASTTGVVLLYVLLITFIPIPKENQRFVDIALAFLLGWISSNSQYLTGGSATPKKNQLPADGTTTAEFNLTATTKNEEPKPKEDEK